MSIPISSTSNTTILLTGGTGFLGAYILKALVEKGYHVRAIKRAESKMPFFIDSRTIEKVEWVEGDILDIIALDAAMEGVDAIIHAAAKVSFHKEDNASMYNINVEGTANVVNLALEHQIKRLVYISSVAALGRTGAGETVSELKKWTNSNINTHYAISKHKAEMEMWRAMAEGLNGVIINPSTILGFGDWNNSSAAIFKNVYNGFPYYTEGINGFVDVEDVATATLMLMESTIENEQFIVSGNNWSFKQLLDTIAIHLQKPTPYRKATPFLSQLAWRAEALKSFFTGTKPLLTKESARVAQSKTYFDNSKILNALPGFMFTPLEKSIAKSCGKYLAAMNTLQS